MEKKLKSSPKKAFLVLFICTLFSVTGVWMIQDGESMGWLVLIFFGLGVLVSVINLLPGASYLFLTEEGLEVCSLFRKSLIPWKEVDHFIPIKMHGNNMIGIEFRKNSSLNALTKKAFGVNGALPETYGMNPNELAQLLNNLLRQYG